MVKLDQLFLEINVAPSPPTSPKPDKPKEMAGPLGKRQSALKTPAGRESAATSTKRKAEAQAASPKAKVQRKDSETKSMRSGASSMPPKPASTLPKPAVHRTSSPLTSTPPNGPSGGRDASKPAAQPAATSMKRKADAEATNPKVRVPRLSKNPDLVVPGPPPKGSFQDLMMRAKIVDDKIQERLKLGITLPRAPIVYPTQEEQRAKKKARLLALEKHKAWLRAGTSSSSKAARSDSGEKVPREPSRPKLDKASIRAAAKQLMFENRKRRGPELETSYKGKMGGPSQPQAAGKSTTNVGSTNIKEKPKRTTAGTISNGKALAGRRLSTQSKDGLASSTDASSPASSNMEADVFDVDTEERQALKVARLEDAKALRQEMELKRLKQARKEAAERKAKKKPPTPLRARRSWLEGIWEYY